MYVYPDGTVTGSVNVAELEAIRKVQKSAGKRRLAAIGPVQTADELTELLAGNDQDSESEPTAETEPETEPEPDSTADSELETTERPRRGRPPKEKS